MERRELTKNDADRMLLGLVQRVQARKDLAPLLEFDRDVYEHVPYSGSYKTYRTERVRLGADDDVYYVPLEQ